MATTGMKFDFLWALLGGIIFFILAVLLEDTSIFNAIDNLPEIGLFLGVILGGFRERIGIF